MIIMFCVSIGGLAPLSVISIIMIYTLGSRVILDGLVVWYLLSLLFNMIDLFLYNHEVRRYLAGYFFRCVRH